MKKGASTPSAPKGRIALGRLTPLERKALRRFERIVFRGAEQFVRVGLALAEIRDKRLYRETHSSFRLYCLDRFQFGRAHGYRLIEEASAVVDLRKVSPIGDMLDLNEGQARELVRVPGEMRSQVLQLALQRAGANVLTAKLIHDAAIEMGVISNGKLMPNGGNDGVNTPDWLAAAIAKHFMPAGSVLEPCRGSGAFVKAIPGCDWYDIAQERDFLQAQGHWDWIITNPPFSAFRAFLRKSLEVADNIVFISLVNAWFIRARQADIRSANFGIVELLELPVPKSWPQFGLTLAACWLRRGWRGGIAYTRLEVPSGIGDRNRAGVR